MFDHLEKKYNIKYILKDTALVSYPKSGRTWLRMIFAKIANELGYDTNKNEMLPAFHYTPAQLDEKIGKDLKVIFLRRDEADATVSYFSEKSTSTRSGVPYTGTVSEFLRDKDYGINAALSFNESWINLGEKYKDFCHITYEQLKQDPVATLKELCSFVGIECEEGIIQTAVEYSSFNNMKKIDNGEGENLLRKYKGNFGVTPGRVRKGLVKGYLTELSKEDIEYVEKEKRKLYGND